MSSEILFHKRLLKRYQVLDRPGSFLVSVAHDVTSKNLYIKDDYPRYLITLRVIKPEDLSKLIKILDEHNKVPFNLISTLFLTGAIFNNDTVDISLLPIKGENVLATFEYVNSILLCTNIKLIDRDDLTYINLSAIDDLHRSIENLLKRND